MCCIAADEMTELKLCFQLLPAGHNIKINQLKLYGVPKYTFLTTLVSELYCFMMYI